MSPFMICTCQLPCSHLEQAKLLPLYSSQSFSLGVLCVMLTSATPPPPGRQNRTYSRTNYLIGFS